MAYEYEDKLKNRLLDLEFDTWEETVQFEREYRELERVYRKAKAWEELKKHINEKVDNYMTLYRETKDPTYSILNSHFDTLLGYIEELEANYEK